ncbi:hypothetical protein AYI70_g3766 [Smittium culicis]|uniref:Uncharacterized protein n=2 Tax=Smittium culicis TaxID=133412 RepID=A0A1R1YQU5_9FUNG|nr:hypothetical protein AYI70_g3766 [Smittium culicis]OMJ29279.1 hypothetical protein AYI69_g1224 [Smittium culicis]
MFGSVSRVSESVVINATQSKVWQKVQSLDLSFWSEVVSVEPSSSAANASGLAIGSTRTVTFKDGTVQIYRVVEVSELEHSISYELVESTPPVSYMSSISTIKVMAVTSNDSAFVMWSSLFSSDGGVEVTEDSKFKKRDALADLAASF